MERHIPRYSPPRPVYVVWELTLRCDLACAHCGSRAGRPRAAELSLREALDLVQQLKDLGTREVAFIGGEAYLQPDWLALVRAVREAGMRPTMTTGGRGLSASLAMQAKAAGLAAVSVSVDGLDTTHDRLRGVAGSHKAALLALEHVASAGLEAYANTQFNRLNLPEVEALADQLLARGIRAWQVQLTGPMGRAADRAGWLLQPWQILELVDRLAAVAQRAAESGCTLNAGNNLGYYGPNERWLRLEPYQGCAAGRHLLGVESNGDVKGCPSLPSAPYVGGNVREAPLAELWERAAVGFTRNDRQAELWGRCAGCYYAPTCQGGCSWTAHAALGRRGNMPWCYHRAERLRAEGLRERLVQVEQAPGAPFDFGRFELVEEPWPDQPSPG